jgi:RNA polymerase sigma factor (sigma-70 family)
MTEFNLDSEWEIYYPKVYGYFLRRITNRMDVEDLTSVVLTEFFGVLTNQEKRQKITNQNAYLWKVAYNHLADFIKNNQKRPLPIIYDENFQAEDQSLEKFVSKEYKDRVSNLVNCAKEQLKTDDFEILVMSIFEEKTSKEVAENLKMSSDNIRQRLSRGLKKLREKCRQIWFN